MKQLIEDYKRRLATVKQLNFEFKSNGSEHDVRKKERFNTKPFKSRQQINTVKTVVNHPILNIPAYSFEEDSSVVKCRRCTVVEFSECNVKSL